MKPLHWIVVTILLGAALAAAAYVWMPDVRVRGSFSLTIGQPK
jgi:hypothetical protein